MRGRERGTSENLNTYPKTYLRCLGWLLLWKTRGLPCKVFFLFFSFFKILGLWVCFYFFLLFFNSFLFYYSCPNCSPFALLYPAHPPAPTVNPHTIVCVHGSFIHVLCLVPFPSFHCCPLSPSHFQPVPHFHACVSMLLVSLFCSLDSSYKSDHMVFVFNNWLISLSIIVSSSDHAVAKGRSSFFFFCCVVSHCVNAPQFFNPFICWWALRLFPTIVYWK